MGSSITETHPAPKRRRFRARAGSPTVLAILFAISFSHLLNDTIQSLIPAIYPLLKTSFHLSFVQVAVYHACLPNDGFDSAAVCWFFY